MPNQVSRMVEERVLSFSIAHPGLGPKRVSGELARPKWGGIECFYVGRLRGTEGAIWQLSAIDIRSSFAWAELVVAKKGLSWHASAARPSVGARASYAPG
jgi:hypothetical protein